MPQKKQSSLSELRVGFLVLLSIAILIIVIFAVSCDLSGFGDIINASQTDVSNLNEISSDIKEMTQRIKEGKGTAGRLLNDEALYLNLNKTILQAESLVAAIKQGEGTAGRFINDPALYNQ